MVPQPSIVEPSRENPRTVVALADIIKPAASELPPAADNIFAPSKLNWKPAIGVSVLYSTVPLLVT